MIERTENSEILILFEDDEKLTYDRQKHFGWKVFHDKIRQNRLVFAHSIDFFEPENN